MAKRIPGLYFDYETKEASIDKRIEGIGRIRKRFRACSYQAAEEKYYDIVNKEKERAAIGQCKTFGEAVEKYMETANHRSLSRDVQALILLQPYLAALPLNQIHMDVLQKYIKDRRKQGVRSGTISRDLAVVRRILTLSARSWRDSDNKPWISAVPILELPKWEDKKENYPLDWSQQQDFFKQLPDYLARMALFAVNTGAREQVVCWLQWDWELYVDELNTSVFITPGRSKRYSDGVWSGEKNKCEGLYILNRFAKDIIEGQRGLHPRYVFPYKGRRLHKMQTTSWKTAWRKAGLPTDNDIRKGPHNLRHTFARRLRNAGVSLETRKALLNHKNDDITIAYSPAEIKELINAVERLTSIQVTRSTVIRRIK